MLVGAWMTFDGARALVAGDYVTPRTGPHAGQLGPWATLVERVGIPPRAAGMKVAFVALGLAWLVAALAFRRRSRSSGRWLVALAALTLWYLPIGTLASILVIAGVATLHARGG